MIFIKILHHKRDIYLVLSIKLSTIWERNVCRPYVYTFLLQLHGRIYCNKDPFNKTSFRRHYLWSYVLTQAVCLVGRVPLPLVTRPEREEVPEHRSPPSTAGAGSQFRNCHCSLFGVIAIKQICVIGLKLNIAQMFTIIFFSKLCICKE